MSTGDRFVVLGVARPRAAWFHTVARWATTAEIPAEFVKCISTEELIARLASGRPFSAVLLDGGTPGVDRDLIDSVRDAGCAPIVVDDEGRSRQWLDLGAAAVLPPALERAALLDVLATHATMLPRGEQVEVALEEPLARLPWSGSLVAVCGPGGTGASTAAAALAQGLAVDRRWGEQVLLADLALRAEQAMLNDVGDVAPGVQDLVDGHRLRHVAPEEVRALTYAVPARGYRLLLGLRRPHHWAGLRPRAFHAALESVRRTFAVTVCDLTADFEGEDEGGSADVEERNLMARTAVAQASVVFAVGDLDMKGLHSLARLLAELDEAGVPPARVVPVFNRAPRAPRVRARLARAVSALAEGAERATPVFLPRRGVDEALRDGVALPAGLANVLAGAFRATLRRQGAATSTVPEPRLVVPGSVGAWSPQGVGER